MNPQHPTPEFAQPTEPFGDDLSTEYIKYNTTSGRHNLKQLFKFAKWTSPSSSCGRVHFQF